MKIEIGRKKPDAYIESWPNQYKQFSHYEFVAGVPQTLFIISTLKENGKPNLCFHSWSCFSGDEGGYFAILSGLMNHTHTYSNIIRTREFCVNFISLKYYDAGIKTTTDNEDDSDEIEVSDFNLESSTSIKTPRIKEAFLSYECKLESVKDLSGKGISSLIIGKVVNAATLIGYNDIAKICSDEGFMHNIHSPKDPISGIGEKIAVSTLKPQRVFD